MITLQETYMFMNFFYWHPIVFMLIISNTTSKCLIWCYFNIKTDGCQIKIHHKKYGFLIVFGQVGISKQAISKYAQDSNVDNFGEPFYCAT